MTGLDCGHIQRRSERRARKQFIGPADDWARIRQVTVRCVNSEVLNTRALRACAEVDSFRLGGIDCNITDIETQIWSQWLGKLKTKALGKDMKKGMGGSVKAATNGLKGLNPFKK